MDSATGSTISRTPYGKACNNCARVKCRCIYNPDTATCVRCQRLKKDCVPANPVRKRRGQKLHTSKTAKLEEKLDGLVSLLRSQTIVSHPQPTIPDLSSAFTPITSTFPLRSEKLSLPKTSIFDDVSIYGIPVAIAEEQLAKFQDVFLPFFPFVHIPEAMSAFDLRLQKPFLWLVIMSLTTRSVAQQMAMGRTIVHIVSTRIVAEHEKSLDLLLGLICYLTWFHYHKKNNPYLIMWTQLAVALVFELGIHRSAPRDAGKPSSKVDCAQPGIPEASPTQSMEERRALLGMFVVSTMVWISLKQMEAIRWTSYMDDCILTLRIERETELDSLLVHQAKCCVIANQMTRPSTEWGNDSADCKPRAVYIIEALHQQLHGTRESLPPEFSSNRTVLLALYGTEIIGKECLLHKPTVRDQTDIRRLEALDSLLTAIERWFETFHQIPLADWIGIPFGIFDQFSHCIVVLFKLATLDVPGWDKKEVEPRADLLVALERLAQGFERVAESAGLVDAMGDSGVFFRAGPVTRSMKAKFEAELTPPAEMGSISNIEASDDFAMLFAEDPWLPEMFASLRDFDGPQ